MTGPAPTSDDTSEGAPDGIDDPGEDGGDSGGDNTMPPSDAGDDSTQPPDDTGSLEDPRFSYVASNVPIDDFDFDGHDDVLVGAPGNDEKGTGQCRSRCGWKN